ncbi:MAG TPA: sigma-E factor negative regulatory protein [Methylotenera sp.]|nr:sigma-E factor negative regulatory protein [Methylotenera sp.]
MNEQISALLDGEIALTDAAHLITSVQSNRQAAETWSQYNLIGDAMRDTPSFSANFKHNLMLKLDQEPTVLSPNPALTNPSNAGNVQVDAPSKIHAGWSIAASFTAVMVVGWMVMHQQTLSSDELAPAEVAQNVPDIPAEYLIAHQASAPSGGAYYIQSVGYTK